MLLLAKPPASLTAFFSRLGSFKTSSWNCSSVDKGIMLEGPLNLGCLVKRKRTKQGQKNNFPELSTNDSKEIIKSKLEINKSEEQCHAELCNSEDAHEEMVNSGTFFPSNPKQCKSCE
jgi:hypothetical protein